MIHHHLAADMAGLAISLIAAVSGTAFVLDGNFLLGIAAVIVAIGGIIIPVVTLQRTAKLASVAGEIKSKTDGNYTALAERLDAALSALEALRADTTAATLAASRADIQRAQEQTPPGAP